jgi:cation:H+ antiporter
MLSTWISFIIASTFVVGAGIFIGRISGAIGERLGLGKAWAGAVLLSFATTLPELVSTVTVSLRGDTAMAIGGILGSVIFNLLILVIVDLIDPRPIFHRLSFSHVFVGLTGCILLAILCFGLMTGLVEKGILSSVDHIGFIGVPSVMIIGAYLLSQLLILQIARDDASKSNGVSGDEQNTNVSFFDKMQSRTLFLMYGGIVIVIFIAAYHLGVQAEKLASGYHLGATFAGATLLGIITSLPEVTNAVTCARRREIDLVAGNIFGANAFVIVVIAIADFFYVKGSIFHSLNERDIVSSVIMASIGIIMQGVVLGALVSKNSKRIWRIGIASIFLAVLYGISLFISYRFSSVL